MNAHLDFCVGAQGAHIQEARSCTVSAAAAAFNILWSEAYQLLAKAGRKPRRGIVSARLMANPRLLSPYGEAREAKWFYRKDYKAGMTLKTFLRLADPGKRYYVTITHHAFAVIGGRVRDYELRLNSRVKFVWEVTPKLDRPGAINLPVPVALTKAI